MSLYNQIVSETVKSENDGLTTQTFMKASVFFTLVKLKGLALHSNFVNIKENPKMHCEHKFWKDLTKRKSS